jgi:uroporphyrinogen-III decarboxylase
MFNGRKPIEGAPYWYNTPLDKLDFEWSREETREIERICEKILKNIAEEGGMTPLERYKAAMFGKPKDRMFMGIPHNNPYTVKVLDSAADAYKPIDIYQFPKLYVKAHLAMMARFKLDYSCIHNINYGEDMWGGQSKMIEYGNPIIKGNPPVKSMEDLEGMPIPDPRKDGLYPGYLWACREYRRIVEKYKLPIPVWTSICPGPPLLVMMGMMGWTEFSMALRKNPELVKACSDIAVKFLCGFGKAMVEEVSPDGITM